MYVYLSIFLPCSLSFKPTHRRCQAGRGRPSDGCWQRAEYVWALSLLSSLSFSLSLSHTHSLTHSHTRTRRRCRAGRGRPPVAASVTPVGMHTDCLSRYCPVSHSPYVSLTHSLTHAHTNAHTGGVSRGGGALRTAESDAR